MSGTTDEEHLANLEAALECLEKKRTALREGNCEFMMDSIDFLSQILDKQGISPCTPSESRQHSADTQAREPDPTDGSSRTSGLLQEVSAKSQLR